MCLTMAVHLVILSLPHLGKSWLTFSVGAPATGCSVAESLRASLPPSKPSLLSFQGLVPTGVFLSDFLLVSGEHPHCPLGVDSIAQSPGEVLRASLSEPGPATAWKAPETSSAQPRC